MEAKIEKITKITLTLNEEEATWLKNIMQNPLYNERPEDEHPQTKKIRYRFFEILKGVL